MEVRSVKCKVRSKSRAFALLALLCTSHFALLTSHTFAQGIRDRIRGNRDKTTSVNEAQASELTLTITQVEVRPIQVWVRTAGTGEGQVLRAFVPNDDARFIKPDAALFFSLGRCAYAEVLIGTKRNANPAA